MHRGHLWLLSGSPMPETTSVNPEQSYGTFMVMIMQEFGVDVHEAKAFLEESPGEACNPNRAGNPNKP